MPAAATNIIARCVSSTVRALPFGGSGYAASDSENSLLRLSGSSIMSFSSAGSSEPLSFALFHEFCRSLLKDHCLKAPRALFPVRPCLRDAGSPVNAISELACCRQGTDDVCTPTQSSLPPVSGAIARVLDNQKSSDGGILGRAFIGLGVVNLVGYWQEEDGVPYLHLSVHCSLHIRLH